MKLRWARATFLCLTGLLMACGGGGGGPPAVIEALAIDLGLLSATQPTSISRALQNPLSQVANVTAVPSTGPFAFDPASLPASIPPNGTFNATIVFTPAGPGVYTQTLTLFFSSAGQQRQQDYDLRGTGEPLNWTLTPNPIDFPSLLPGLLEDRDVTIRNGSALSPVTFVSGTSNSAGVSLLGNPFPLTIVPGGTAQLSLRFLSPSVADHGGRLRLTPSGQGGQLDIPFTARGTAAGEQVIDLGNQTLTNDLTPELTVDVPVDAVSLSIEASSLTEDLIGLHTLIGPGDHVYENDGSGPYRWLEAPGGFVAQLPRSDRAELQLIPGGGTYRFRFRRLAGAGASLRVRAIIERRANGNETAGVLPLNVYLANGIAPTAATAGADPVVQGALTRMNDILGARGLTLGDIDYYDIDDPSLDQFFFANPAPLLTQSSMATENRLNLFFVTEVDNGALLGFSAALSGPRLNGLASSGVACAFAGLTAEVIGYVAAHEVCHYLGVWHTVEGDGTFDLMDDTPQCPVFGTNAVCTVEGGGLLMHWQANLGTTLSPGQAVVMRRHPCVEPTAADLGKPRVLPAPPVMSPAAQATLRAAGCWCGTCRGR